MSRLMDAIDAMNARKLAAGLVPGANALELDTARRILVGLDVEDVEELASIAGNVGSWATMGVAAGRLDPVGAFTALWADGFTIGLMYAELIRQDDAGPELGDDQGEEVER